VSYDEETLMAYADGELDAGLRAEIAAAIDKDPALAARVEKHRALRAEVAGAFATVLNQPVPERLRQAAGGGAAASASAPLSVPARGKVLQFPARGTRAPATPWRAREWMAMAASLVLGLFVSWRIFQQPSDPGLITAGSGALVARGALAQALDQQLASLQDRNGPVVIGLSFKARGDSYCRTFTMRATSTAGLACRVGSEWQIPVTTATELPTGEMQPVTTGIPPAVLQAVESRIAGDVLDVQGEEQARASGWGGRKD
jgi:anti-sigma factor RsiW